MIKVERPPLPDIKVYKLKKSKLSTKDREFLLTVIEPTSPSYGPFVDRLKDKSEKYTKAEKETLRSIAFYANPANFSGDKKLTTKKGPTFSVYKDSELKVLLRTMFNKKCAYCESLFLSVSPADIEHFRPKSAINRFPANQDEGLIFPGYYWLAADWDNLLWSCISCNRKSNLQTPGSSSPQPLGKQNRFPVADEKLRIRSHNLDLRNEQEHRLILDPCQDDPSEHLTFPLGADDLGITKSKILDNQEPSLKGEASIPVYGLNRVELVFARREEALDLKAIFIGMLRSMEAFIRKKDAQEDFTREKEDFLEMKRRFRAKLSPGAVYLALKHNLLEEFNDFDLLKKFNLKAADLLKPN